MAMRGANVVEGMLDVERHVATFEFELTQPDDGSSIRLPISIQQASQITVEEQKRATKRLRELFASWSEATALIPDAPYMGTAAAAREAESEADAERGGG